VVPDKSEIEQGAFFPPTVIDGWTSARPEDFAPGFLECWKTYRRQTRSSSEAQIFSHHNGAGPSN
jgi:16S rRNA (adenine1518-N6/adenine1519-N6)-dimethyltransferase